MKWEKPHLNILVLYIKVQKWLITLSLYIPYLKIRKKCFYPVAVDEDWDHGFHTRVAKHKELLSCTTFPPSLPPAPSLWAIFKKDTALTVCTDNTLYRLKHVFFYIGERQGGLLGGARLHKCCPISGISCLHSCNALGAVSDQ